jgi:hypothetical protein
MLIHGVISIGVSPPSLLVAQAVDYTTPNFNHFRDGTATPGDNPVRDSVE